MKCPECAGELVHESGGDCEDFSYLLEDWLECKTCGHHEDIPSETHSIRELLG